MEGVVRSVILHGLVVRVVDIIIHRFVYLDTHVLYYTRVFIFDRVYLDLSMNPSQMIRESNQNLNTDNPTRRAWASGRNNSDLLLSSQRNKHLPQSKRAVFFSSFRPQKISEDLYLHVITKYPVEGLILKKLIEDGEYQISSSDSKNSLKWINEWHGVGSISYYLLITHISPNFWFIRYF